MSGKLYFGEGIMSAIENEEVKEVEIYVHLTENEKHKEIDFGANALNVI